MRGLKGAADVNDAAMAVTVSASNADTVTGPLDQAAPLAGGMADTVTGPIGEPTIRREGAAAIGRFLLLRKLGEGGMGEVFSGYDEQLDRKVAIKVLHAAYAPEETQKRTLREAQALARLSHPNVVTVHEVGQVDGDVFVVMEHIDGMTLRVWQDEAQRTVDEILHAYVMAGQGLAAVHAAGMVHRDFKPHNAMIDLQGRVRILDFGLAHARGSASTSTSTEPTAASNTLASQLTAEGAISGTPAYMSPEQFMGGTLDARTDQFSFCVALYEALYKKLPTSANPTSKNAIPALADTLAAPPTRHDIPSRITEAIMRGLSRAPEGRFLDMNALLEMLEFAPRADPSGQSRQRLIFATFLMASMGAWMAAPAEWFDPSRLPRTSLFAAMTVWLVAAAGTYTFRNTLLRNPFHRVRILGVLVMGLAVTTSRAVGILHQESAESVAVRDLFLTCLGVALVTLFLTPRVIALWITLAIAIASIVALAFLPQYLPEIITFAMNATILGYLIAWHRSTRFSPKISPIKVDLARSNRTTVTD